jgi:hypothetical protein
VIASYQVIRTAAAVAAPDSTYSNAPISREADIGLGLGFLALFGASAAYGYVVTGDCKDAKARQGTGEDTLPPPAYGPRQPAPEVWSVPPQAQPTAPAQAAPAPPVTPPPAAAPPERVCTPGATQSCVGVGGCQGGQACSADGTVWQSCDCAAEPDAGVEP